MIDHSGFRLLLGQFEKDVMSVSRDAVEQEVSIRSRNAGDEVRASAKHSLNAYSTLEYIGENDPTVLALPLPVRDVERGKRNVGIKLVIKALEFCKKNPRATGEDLEKLKATKFKGFPIHLNISVLPDLTRYGLEYIRLAQAQSLLQNDPEPIPDSLMSPQSPEAQEADESQGETQINDE